METNKPDKGRKAEAEGSVVGGEMSSYVFGKSVFCDQSNLSASRSYINNTLLTRGILHDADSHLRFNSADAPTVINLLYDFLRKTELDDATRETLSSKIRTVTIENDRLVASEKALENKLAQATRSINVLKNQVDHAKDEIAKTHAEVKHFKDTLNKTNTTLNHVKTQTANDIRKRDVQISRMKEHLIDGGTVRRSKASSSMTIRTNTASINSGPPIVASYAVYDPEPQVTLTKEVDEELLRITQEVSHENDRLAELIQATLASLDALVQIEEEEHPLFSSSAQSVTMLEAQLKVRLTALRNILDMPNYVPLEEVEIRDLRIRELQSRLLQIENEWSAAQSVLKGLTASVLEKTGLQDSGPELASAQILGERTENHQNITIEPLSHFDYLQEIAKTPVAISKENGILPLSTVKLDSRLRESAEDELNILKTQSEEPDSTPIRIRREKTQRKNRRITMGLVAREEDLRAELEGLMREETETHVPPCP